MDEISVSQLDPELVFIKERYRPHFRRAFREAVAALEPRQRVVLRMYLVDELNFEQLGVLYRVNKSTISRWIAQARETLLSATRSAMAKELELDPTELNSLMRLFRSQSRRCGNAHTRCAALGSAAEPSGFRASDWRQ